MIPLRLAISASGHDPTQILAPDKEEELKAKFGSLVTISDTADGGHEIDVPGEAGKRFRDAITGLSRNSSYQVLLYRNCLISLISSAEWFLSQVLRRFFEAHPDAASIKEKTLTLEDLRKIGSISDAESYLITLRVDEIMWGGFEDWIKFLRNTVKLSMGYLTEDEEALIEVFQRRNVMVHNNGVVHPSYISKVKEDLRPGVEAGKPLPVTPDYLAQAISLVEKNFVLIAAELWKKLAPKDAMRANILNDITMKALFAERYVVACGASRFVMEDKQLTEKDLDYGRLNYWQTMKWNGKFEEVHCKISEADFSAKDDLLQLARLVLLDDFDRALPLIEPTLQSGKLKVDYLETWPIFREFRKDSRIALIIEEKRSKESARVQISSDQVEELEDIEMAEDGIPDVPPTIM